MLPTVSYSIAAMMKRIVIITISMVVGGKGMNFYDGFGLVLVFVGLYCYDRWGSKRHGPGSNPGSAKANN
ncbi:unnamed protein product [Ambrosiozyma monospora]|uniref:Unnamed protein product n=1 Tax=Ambrosiozyma monospora TaxID=43982 RepID=A0A9W6YYD6_AMBMO|nr:unnamed protein product [Ambrosiozyma monospora]